MINLINIFDLLKFGEIEITMSTLVAKWHYKKNTIVFRDGMVQTDKIGIR